MTSTGLARTANQHLSLLITQPVSGNATVVLRSFDNTTGVSTIEFQTTAPLNVTINSTILINSYAEATATHGIVFHRMFAYVPDNAFITPS